MTSRNGSRHRPPVVTRRDNRVIFSSFSGFLGHASLGHIHPQLLGFTAAGSALGAVAGSWLMTEKLKRKQVKIVIGIVLLGIAAKMIWGLLG